MSHFVPLRASHDEPVVKSDAHVHVGEGASGKQLENQEQKQDSLITQDSKEEDEAQGNDYKMKISRLTISLREKEEEVNKLKLKVNSNKALLEDRLKSKDKECKQLERDLAQEKKGVTLLNEKLKLLSSKEEELKEKISKLEKEMKTKTEDLEHDKIYIKQLQKQLSEKEEDLFYTEASDAADKRDKEFMIKRVKDLEMESEKNIGEATQRINILEETNKEQLKEIEKLREENATLKGTVEEQGNMKERLTKLEVFHDQVAANHEEEIKAIKSEEETKRTKLEEDLKREFKNESQQRAQSYLQETEQALEDVKKKYKDRLQAREKELQAQLQKINQKKDELKEHLYNREEAYLVLQDSLDKKSATSMELEKQVQDIIKHSAQKDQKIEEISERLALKETENELFKQDFECERKDRERIKGQLIKLQEQHEILKQESAEKEKEAQMKFHSLKQSHGTLEHDLEESRKEIATKGAEIESLEKQHTEEMKKIKKNLKELEAGETDKMKGMEEEIQVLTAQVNAYSREVDKQKGLVTQSQEKHKTEVSELNERLDNEIKSKQQLNVELTKMRQELDSVAKKHETETAELQEKSKQKVQQLQQMIKGANERVENEKKSKDQLASELARMKRQFDDVSRTNQQLDSELARMRQQLDDASADKEELLKTHHEERAKLEDQMEKLKKANIVLKDKVNKQQPSTVNHPEPQHFSHTKLAARQNSYSSAPVPSGPKQVVQSDGDGVLVVPKTEGVTPAHHTDSTSVPDDAPLLSKEEMTRMFNRQGSSDWNQSPQQVEDSLIKEEKRKELAKEADDAVLEVERLRESRLNVKNRSSISTKEVERLRESRLNVKNRSSISTKELSPPSQQTSSKQRTKPKVKKDQPKQKPSDDSDSDIEENKLIDGIDEEIQQMAEDVRKGSRGPSTAEVLFDDGDSSLPYDPNLVCPKCGKQYRVGEIQKLRRHMNEFCTGIR